MPWRRLAAPQSCVISSRYLSCDELWSDFRQVRSKQPPWFQTSWSKCVRAGGEHQYDVKGKVSLINDSSIDKAVNRDQL